MIISDLLSPYEKRVNWLKEPFYVIFNIFFNEHVNHLPQHSQLEIKEILYVIERYKLVDWKSFDTLYEFTKTKHDHVFYKILSINELDYDLRVKVVDFMISFCKYISDFTGVYIKAIRPVECYGKDVDYEDFIGIAKYLTKEMLEMFFQEVEIRSRYSLVIKLLYYSDYKISELINFKFEDEIFCDEEIRSELDEHVEWRKSKKFKNKLLFLNSQNKQIQFQNVYNDMCKSKNRCYFPFNITTKTLKNTRKRIKGKYD